MGRVTGTIAPDPDDTGPLRYFAIRHTYDPVGRLTKVESGELSTWHSEATAPANWTGFTVYKTIDTAYNAQNQKTLEVVRGSNGAAASATQYSYDLAGRLECTAVRMNPGAYSSLPASACTLSTQGSYGPDRITRNVHNTLGQLHKVQKAVGTNLQQDYATYTYSANGNRVSMTDARGYRAEMTFDGLDRQETWKFPSPTSTGVASNTDYEVYGYDANGNRTSLRKRDGSTLTYAFDALNRMAVKYVPERSGLDSSHTRDVYYGYDSASRMTFARFDSVVGEGISMGYDDFGDLRSLGTSLPGLSTSMSFLFDAHGNRTRVTYHDGNYVTYQYDGVDRSKSVLRSGSATLASYAYKASGQRATMGGGYPTSYEYHPDGRLWKLTNTPTHPSYAIEYSFSYNPASQITQMSRSNNAFAWSSTSNVNRDYQANGLNQYTSVAGVSFSHDANGNLTSDGSTTYVYDVENRLVSASGGKTAQLRYDPLGRLYQTSGGTAGTTLFAYDGDALALEFNNSGNILRRYVHGTDAGDDPIVWFEGSGFSDAQQRLLRTDHLGSVVSVTDTTSASFYAVNIYDEYGVPAVANQGRFQYTGQAWVSELGLYYFKARMYSPTLGRFMQTDPIGYEDDVNLYSYVSNNPVNKNDPTGRYGRGTGFTDDEWEKFDNVQHKAADAMAKRADKLDKKADKLDAKGKSGGEALRATAGRLRDGASALRSDGSDGKMANAVDSATYRSGGGSQDGAAYVSRKDRNTMVVNKDNAAAWDAGNRMSKWVVGHESLHTAGMDDQRSGNELAYKYGNDAQRKAYREMRRTLKALENPDHVMDQVY